MKEMNFEKIGKVMDSKAKELAGQASKLEGETKKGSGKEREWLLIFSIIAVVSAFLPYVKVTSFMGTLSVSLFDMVCQELWNLILWLPQIIVLIMVAKKVRYSDIVIPIITGIGFWLNVLWAINVYDDMGGNDYAMSSYGIGIWLIIASLFGINWMAEKLDMGVISLIKRLLKKVVPSDAQNTETQPTNVNVHPVTNESVLCHECGTALTSDAKFCPDCGTAVVIKESHNICSNCGGEYKEGAAFCGNCGEKIN